jgi:hypothetical protein
MNFLYKVKCNTLPIVKKCFQFTVSDRVRGMVGEKYFYVEVYQEDKDLTFAAIFFK